MHHIIKPHDRENKKLSLGDYLCRKSEGQFDIVNFPDDAFSIVTLYEHVEKHSFSSYEIGIEVGRVFRRTGSKKDMSVSGKPTCFVSSLFTHLGRVFCFLCSVV